MCIFCMLLEVGGSGHSFSNLYYDLIPSNGKDEENKDQQRVNCEFQRLIVFQIRYIRMALLTGDVNNG